MTVHTTDQLVSGEVRTRWDDFRMDLLDATGVVIGTLPFDQGRPPTITWDTTARLQRTMRGLNLPAGTYGDIDTTSQSVRAMAIMQNGTEWPLGVFRWADDNELERSWGIDRGQNLVDRATILDQEMTRAVGALPGWNPVTLAIQLAQEVLPPEQIEWTGITYALTAPMSWPPGASRIQVMADLLAQAGYLPPYFDRRGVLQLRPAPDPNAATDPIRWPLGYPVHDGSRSRTNTLLDTPNLFVVYDASGQGGGIIGTYRVPASARHSIERRGYPVPLVKGVSGLASQATADAQAYAMSISDGRTFEYQEFTGAFNPYHDSWDAVDFRGAPWLETRHSVVCVSGGDHAHTLRRVYSPDLAAA